MALIIRKLDTSSRRDVNRFIDLPFRIYRDCPQWVPPLVDDVKLMLNRKKYPFYEHSDADFFVAEREGRMVARIAVLENRHYNEHAHSRTAFFYLFEAEDDPEAAVALFEQIEAWARARGLNKIVGAKGFLQGDGVGVLVEGFEHHPAVGIPYNHAYYGELIERAGYTRQRDFMSAYLPGNVELPPRVRRNRREDDGAPRLQHPHLRLQVRAASLGAGHCPDLQRHLRRELGVQPDHRG